MSACLGLRLAMSPLAVWDLHLTRAARSVWWCRLIACDDYPKHDTQSRNLDLKQLCPKLTLRSLPTQRFTPLTELTLWYFRGLSWKETSRFKQTWKEAVYIVSISLLILLLLEKGGCSLYFTECWGCLLFEILLRTVL